MSWFACFELVFYRLASVATCRQTVETFSLAQSTAWQRMATVGSGSGSHLSPDGGGFSLAQSTAWQRMATVGSGSGSHLSPDGGGFSLATPETTFQDAVVVLALRAAKLKTLWEIC